MPRSSRGAGSTLLQAPALEANTETDVFEVLGESPTETELLVISYREGPDSWLADWQRHVGQMPADLGFIHVGEVTRSATAPTSGAPQSELGFVDAVGDPADLTGLGIQISSYLERWAETDKTVLVYVDSLTTLLQFVELNDAYRFLHVLSGRVDSVDGRAIYRLDPAAHDEQTLATLRSLMDEEIDVTVSST